MISSSVSCNSIWNKYTGIRNHFYPFRDLSDQGYVSASFEASVFNTKSISFPDIYSKGRWLSVDFSVPASGNIGSLKNEPSPAVKHPQIIQFNNLPVFQTEAIAFHIWRLRSKCVWKV